MNIFAQQDLLRLPLQGVAENMREGLLTEQLDDGAFQLFFREFHWRLNHSRACS